MRNYKTHFLYLVISVLKQHYQPLSTFDRLASKEYSLEKAHSRMIDEWDDIIFNTTVYRDTGVSILASVDEIQTMVDDQIVKTQTMRGSPFIKPFEKEIKVRTTSHVFSTVNFKYRPCVYIFPRIQIIIILVTNSENRIN